MCSLFLVCFIYKKTGTKIPSFKVYDAINQGRSGLLLKVFVIEVTELIRSDGSTFAGVKLGAKNFQFYSVVYVILSDYIRFIVTCLIPFVTSLNFITYEETIFFGVKTA